MILSAIVKDRSGNNKLVFNGVTRWFDVDKTDEEIVAYNISKGANDPTIQEAFAYCAENGWNNVYGKFLGHNEWVRPNHKPYFTRDRDDLTPI
jgi:hypothetical protein